MTKPISEWNGNEVQYCLDLYARGHDEPNVPAHLVGSYLTVQMYAAQHDGRPDVAQALKLLRDQWTLEQIEQDDDESRCEHVGSPCLLCGGRDKP